MCKKGSVNHNCCICQLMSTGKLRRCHCQCFMLTVLHGFSLEGAGNFQLYCEPSCLTKNKRQFYWTPRCINTVQQQEAVKLGSQNIWIHLTFRNYYIFPAQVLKTMKNNVRKTFNPQIMYKVSKCPLIFPIVELAGRRTDIRFQLNKICITKHSFHLY